jgi:hypothetical protein
MELFTCERQNMRLTAAGCSRLWLSAQNKDDSPKPWEGRAACVTCSIGAKNSGRTVSPVAEVVALLSKICPRCERLTDRLIRKQLCVSCYNRQCEADRGKNAKGGVPRLCSALHVQAFGITQADRPAGRSVVVGSVTSRAEAMLSLSKTATGEICFGAARNRYWIAPRGNQQMEFGF